MLMDRELSEEVRAHIIEIAMNARDILGIHDLRTRRSGMTYHISFDVEVEPDMTLRAAHEAVRRLEMEILGAYPNAEILIHTDPLGDTFDTRHRVPGVHQA